MNFDPKSPRAGDHFLRPADHADGERVPHTRRLLEQWLEEYLTTDNTPHEWEHILSEQTEIWDAVAPDEPSSAEWLRIQQNIEHELAIRLSQTKPLATNAAPATQTESKSRAGNRTRRCMVGIGILAASFVWGGVWPRTTNLEETQSPAVAGLPVPVTIPIPVDPLADIPTLVMANREDVLVEAVYGTPPVGFQEYDTPCVEELQFATAGDVEVERMDNTEPGVTVSLTASESGMPMIYAVVQSNRNETP